VNAFSVAIKVSDNRKSSLKLSQCWSYLVVRKHEQNGVADEDGWIWMEWGGGMWVECEWNVGGEPRGVGMHCGPWLVDAGGIRTTSALSINPLLVAIANGFTIGVNTHTFILCAANYRNEISVISYMYVKYAGVNQNGFCCFFSFLFTWGTHYRDVTGHSIHTQTGKKTNRFEWRRFLVWK